MNNTIKEGLKSTENLGMKYSSYLDEKDFNKMILEGRTEDEYLEDYCMIIDYALLRGLKRERIDFYTEKHHIFPKCMSGENEDYNYVLLSALEHIVVHILLYRIYPNFSMYYAVERMIKVGKEKLNSNLYTERSLAIEKINLDIIAKIRELFIGYRRKPVVCYDLETLDVIKVYDGVLLTKDDGFSAKNIGTVLSKKPNKDGYIRRSVGGYGWASLSEFEYNHNDKLEIYYNNISLGIIPEIGNLKERAEHTRHKSFNKYVSETHRKVIAFNDNIVKLYNCLSDTDKDGFSISVLSNILNNKWKWGNFHRGYFWMYIEEFEKQYPTKINMISNSVTISAIRKDNRIVCCDKDFNILKIYSNLKDVTKDGFCHTTVCEVLSSRVFYRGYYWYKISTFDWKHRDKLEKYYSSCLENDSNEARLLPKNPINSSKEVINCDENGNIFGIYKSIHEASRETKISYQNISWAINSKTKKNRKTGTYWYSKSEYLIKFPNNKL